MEISKIIKLQEDTANLRSGIESLNDFLRDELICLNERIKLHTAIIDVKIQLELIVDKLNKIKK